MFHANFVFVGTFFEILKNGFVFGRKKLRPEETNDQILDNEVRKKHSSNYERHYLSELSFESRLYP